MASRTFAMEGTTLELIRGHLLAWYRLSRRRLPWRASADPYHIWVSEVMLQQTRAKTVVRYYESFLARFADIESLSNADLDEVLKTWEGMGYYARARNLHKAARVVRDEHTGMVPEDPAVFRTLPGVGDYICAAVQSIAFNHPLAVVDGNVKRVLARLFEIDAPVNAAGSAKVFVSYADKLLDRRDPGTFNQALMELGAMVCRPGGPDCDACPVAGVCRAYLAGRQRELPVRKKKPPVPTYHVAVGVIERDDRVLLTRRPLEGLLGGLWEFPGGKVKGRETAEQACVREIREEVNLAVELGAHLGRISHAYTHFKIDVDVFRCRYTGGEVALDGPTDYRWVLREEIAQYPLPRANHKILPLLDPK
jgi:A/G-specific adenine glycosylase